MEQESWKKTWKLRCWAEKCFVEPERPAGIHLLVRDHEGPLEHHMSVRLMHLNCQRVQIFFFFWKSRKLSVKEEKWYSTAVEVSTVSSLFTPPWFVLFNFGSVTCLKVCMESQEHRVGEKKKHKKGMQMPTICKERGGGVPFPRRLWVVLLRKKARRVNEQLSCCLTASIQLPGDWMFKECGFCSLSFQVTARTLLQG